MTILVTGATGTVGSKVVRELRDAGVGVRAFVRDREKAAATLGDGVDLTVGDFADAESIGVALKGADQVFLSCGNDPRQVEYETNLIDAAAASGTRRIVKLSALGAQAGSRLGFWDWQGRIEDHLRASGTPAALLRPNFYMSNVLASAETIRAAGQLFLPAGMARVAMIDPSDVAGAAAAVLTDDGHDGRSYVLTGPAAITFGEVAEDLSAAIGRPVQFVDIPDAAAREAMTGSGMPGWMADNLVTLFGLLREGAAEQTSDTVRKLTGREPRGFEQFARDHAGAFAA